MKNIKKVAEKKIRKVEKATCRLLATYEGIAYIHLLEVTQTLYMQKKYDLVLDICDAAIRDIKSRY